MRKLLLLSVLLLSACSVNDFKKFGMANQGEGIERYPQANGVVCCMHRNSYASLSCVKE